MTTAFATGDLSPAPRLGERPHRGAGASRAAARVSCAAKAAALAAGALGCSISGSGPTAFALADDDAHAAAIGAAMQTAYASAGVEAITRCERVSVQGARVEVET